MPRSGSEGSLPTYSQVAAPNGIQQPSIQGQMARGTFSRIPPPTLIEMEDVGEDLEADQPPPPGTGSVVLPPPPPGVSAIPLPPPPPGMTLRSGRISN